MKRDFLRMGRRKPHVASRFDAARRATRARDHLERKRTKERRRREREVHRAERIDRAGPWRLLLGPAVLALSIGLGVLLAPTVTQQPLIGGVRLERVSVQGASALTPDAIIAAAGLELGAPFASLDLDAVRAAIEAEPWIVSTRLLRLPAGELLISVVERSAVARWEIEPETAPSLVDATGVRFSGALPEGGELPLIRGSNGDLQGDDAVSTAVLEILAALDREPALTADRSALTLRLPDPTTGLEAAAIGAQTGYVLRMGESGPTALLGHRLLSSRVSRLAALVASGEPSFRDAQVIDLRYADRAVLRAEPASG